MRKLVTFLVALLMVAGCRGGAAPAGRSFTDGAGRQLILGEIPRRIVSMAPANTEILFALGLGSRVVGVTTWCNYPPEAAGTEKVGDAWAPNYELIVGLEPDLVLAAGTAESEIVTRLEALGIPVFVVDAPTIEAVGQQILLIGEVTGASIEAGDIAAGIGRRLDDVRGRVMAAGGERPSVFWVLDEFLWTVGPGSFVHDLITLAGGRNLAEGLGLPYAQYSLEVLIEQDPDVIIAATLDPSFGPGLADLPGWNSLKAVREGRVYRVDGDLVSRPGPRVAEGVETVARLLYPEIFR
ncbi:MAG: ABC transporter substrate-binding protein [bacterium]|nr:ABC transporter substrate-binding protein [bacterium]